jgi:hypothetical protein
VVEAFRTSGVTESAAASFRRLTLLRRGRSRGTSLPTDALRHPGFRALLASLPTGNQRLRGIPFRLADGDIENRWLWVTAESGARHSVAVEGLADYLLFAHFSLPPRDAWDPASDQSEPWRVVLDPGEHLATYALVYGDGTEHVAAVRRRFEVSDLTVEWGHAAFAARPHRADRLLDWQGPHAPGWWGLDQTTCLGPSYYCEAPSQMDEVANYWLYALPNPHPDLPLTAVRLEPLAGCIGVGAVTTFQGAVHPLRYRALETLRIVATDSPRLAVSQLGVDLGDLGRPRKLSPPDAVAWLRAAPGSGVPMRGEAESPLLLEVVANEAATLKIGRHSFAMADVYREGRVATADGRVRIELLPRRETRVKVVVTDALSGRPTPARVHLHAADGRYLPPDGHRAEVNDRWFEDYGADLQLGTTTSAYVDGTFDVLLPSGDVFVEVMKGFEYRPLREKVQISPAQRELRLTLDRVVDWRSAGWVTADTHVHFLSPQTAWLEAQAEGVNVVNLLAAQWGDLFTNIGDLTGALSGVSRGDTLIWVGTENRQHFLGHLSLLGGQCSPVAPLSAAGPSESYLGDPVWSSLADWADACHRDGGVAIAPHFPVPYCEVVADAALGKIDAVEIADLAPTAETYAMREWYRLLNAGFRVAVVGGTDKMSAAIPIGGVRTYAKIGPGELTFGAWADAVSSGRTFMSSGPLIDFTVDGHVVGDQVRLGPGGGFVEVVVDATCQQPLAVLEVIMNGRVVAREEAGEDQHRLHLATRLHVAADGWLAARCLGTSAMYRPPWARWPVTTGAHTSPVYLAVGGKSPNGVSDLTYLATIVEGGLTWLDTLATQADPSRHAQVRATFTDALRLLAAESARSPSDTH